MLAKKNADASTWARHASRPTPALGVILLMNTNGTAKQRTWSAVRQYALYCTMLDKKNTLLTMLTRRHNDSSRDTVSPAGADLLRPLALGCPGKIITQLGIGIAAQNAH